MISPIQYSQFFDLTADSPEAEAAAAAVPVEKEAVFQWNKEAKAIFNSACISIIYLNGGKTELSKDRVTVGNPINALSPKTIKYILERGNFPQFKTLSKQSVKNHLHQLREQSKKRGSTLEEDLQKQYEELEVLRTGDEGKKIPALWLELDKFGIKPEEYNQWLPAESVLRWDEEKEAIFDSACLVLLYLNGGRLELPKERASRGISKSALFPKAIKHILEKGDFPGFKTLLKDGVEQHLSQIKQKSKKQGVVWEEEILRKYQKLEQEMVIDTNWEEIPAIWEELRKFGIQPEEYDKWVPIDNCFRWDKEREAIFTSACVTLVYLNGGKLELPQEEKGRGKVQSLLSYRAIEYILKKGNFPAFTTLPKRGIQTHLWLLKQKSKKSGSVWEEEVLKKYQELQEKMVIDTNWEEIPAIWEEAEKFGIKPDDYDSWSVMQAEVSSKRRNSRKRAAEELPDREAEPEQKRANHAIEPVFQVNQLTNLRDAIAGIRAEIIDQ